LEFWRLLVAIVFLASIMIDLSIFMLLFLFGTRGGELEKTVNETFFLE